MLKFDKTHQSIDENIDKKKGRKTLKRIFALGLAVAGLFLFSGCAQTIPCDIENEHAHYYVNSENIGRYIVSEQSYLGLFNRVYRTDKYIELNTEQQKEYVKFIDDNRLYSIEENIDQIYHVVACHQPYLKYQYKDDEYVTDVSYDEDGNVSYSSHWETHYYWTTNPNHSRLTGRERVYYEIYYGYKLEKQDNGSIKVVKSPYAYSNIDALIAAGYNYIKDDFHQETYSSDLNNILEFKAQIQAEMHGKGK